MNGNPYTSSNQYYQNPYGEPTGQGGMYYPQSTPQQAGPQSQMMPNPWMFGMGGTSGMGGGAAGGGAGASSAGGGASSGIGALGPIAAIAAAVAATKGYESRNPDSTFSKTFGRFNMPTFNQIQADPKHAGLGALTGTYPLMYDRMNDEAKGAKPEWEGLLGY